MNLYYELFYKHYVEGLLFSLPIHFWSILNEALAAFPTIDSPSTGFPQSSRRTKKIQIIVLHHTGSLEMAKALKWFSNPNNYASTHWVIDLDGFIQQLVPEESTALHINNSIYNHSRLVAEMSIGIHLVGNGFDGFTQVQYEAIAMLCAHLQEKYLLENDDILKHSEVETVNSVASANDPAPWDEEKFLELLDIFKNI